MPVGSGFDIKAIKKALYDFATAALPQGPALDQKWTIAWKNDKDAPRALKNFCELRLVGPYKPGMDDQSHQPLISGSRRFTISVQTYSDDPDEAFAKASDLQSALEIPELGGILEAAGIGVGQINEVQDLSAVLDNEWEQRAFFDFEIWVASNITSAGFGQIDSATFTPTFSGL